MAPPRGKKRKSGETDASALQHAPNVADQTVPTGTTSSEESPRKKRKVGITLAQKQALIDNIQLEITERARKLRAQYNLQAQGLRTRIEIRVGRIPDALRKITMGELLEKSRSTAPPAPKPTIASIMNAARPPPVPEKDHPVRPSPQRSTAAESAAPIPAPAPAVAPRAGPGRPPKRRSAEMDGTDKENHDTHTEQPKKRIRGANPTAGPHPSQVLSPTSSNSRLNPNRPASPTKKPSTTSLIARPASPVKATSGSGLLSSMVEKARSTTRAAATRKETTASSTSSTSGATSAAATRTRRGAATAPTKASATRTARRVSGVSESSDGSTGTVVRKTVGRPPASAKAAPAAPAAAKRTVMGTIRKGVAGATARKAAPAAKTAAAPATTRSGRVLRKRV